MTGLFGIQRYAVMPVKALTKVPTGGVPLPGYLNALGIPGMTAYFGLLGYRTPGGRQDRRRLRGRRRGRVARRADRQDQGRPRRGDHRGRRQVPDAHRRIRLRRRGRLQGGQRRAGLREHCPDGIDVFFDNVGGDVLEAGLRNLARGARIVLCGAVSQYNEGALHGPRNYMSLLVKRARMEGFVDVRLRRPLRRGRPRNRGLDQPAASSWPVSTSSTAWTRSPSRC